MERGILILDVDGVLVKSGWLEIIWVKIQKFLGIESIPKFFFLIKEAIDFIKTPRFKPEAVIFFEQLEKRDSGDYKVGIITDRSYLSLAKILKRNKISFDRFDFIQVRKIWLDRFSRKIKFNNKIRRCSKVKPHIHVFARLELYRVSCGALKQNVQVADDSEETRSIVSNLFEFRIAPNLKSIDF